MSCFGRAPVVAIWETTRACALACVHCRAEAIPRRDPDELSTDEGKRLLDRVRAFGDPPRILVLTGGDPLRRADIAELVAHGTRIGLSVSLTPSGTAAVTEDKLRALKQAGLARLAVSLDGVTAERHDAFRRVRGSHAHTLRIIERTRSVGLPFQINTTVCRQTADDLPALAARMSEFGVVLWALLFLIPVGRARTEHALTAVEIERVLDWAAELQSRVPFPIKTTEAPHYWRIRAARGGHAAPCASVPRVGRAVTDGNGFVFIDHVGRICPSGFLPLATGNVRVDDLVTVYRESLLFLALRDPARLGGRCGRCEYRDQCGGSRARAHALTGDVLAEDPGCAYQPRGDAPSAPLLAIAAIAGGSDAPIGVSREQVMQSLGTVFDPELGMSIVDLGLVYGVEVDGTRVAITMTLTAPGCPIHDAMSEWVQQAVMKVPGVSEVDVTITFDPSWTPDRIRPGLLT